MARYTGQEGLSAHTSASERIAKRMHRAETARAVYLAPVGLLAVLAAIVRWHGQLPYPDARYAFMDHYRYIAMAAGNGSELATEQPFCWRVLVPYLVRFLHGALGLSVLDGFWLVTLAGVVGATLALMWMLRGLGLSQSASVAGGLAYVLLGPAVGLSLWAYQLVDPLALCLVVLACGCAVHCRGRALLFVAILGALAKEATLLGSIFALAWAWQHRDRELTRWAAVSLASGLAVLVLLHLLIPTHGGWTLLTTLDIVWRLSSWRWSNMPLVADYLTFRFLAVTVGAWLVLFPTALLQMWHPPRFWRQSVAWSLLAVLAAAQMLVATDTDRLAVYAFPAIIAASCFEVEHLAAQWRVSRWALWLPILAVQGYWWLAYAGWMAGSVGVPTLGMLDRPHLNLAAAVLILTAGSVIYARLSMRKPVESLR